MVGYLIKLRYNGKNYYGIIPQPGKRTILSEIIKVVGKPKRIRVCCRTDKGVSAYENYIYLEFGKEVEIPRRINKDIVIQDVVKIRNFTGFRDLVKCKKYIYVGRPKLIFKPKYLVLEDRKIEVRNESYKDFDINLVNDVVKYFIGKKSFHNFTSDKYESYLCDIYDIKVKFVKGLFYLEIKGNRFLRHMVRKIASFLMSYGYGVFKEEFLAYIFSGNLEPKPPSAPAENLILYKVYFKDCDRTS